MLVPVHLSARHTDLFTHAQLYTHTHILPFLPFH